jgi:hypothetical protein
MLIMESTAITRVLVVANRTASTPRLLDEVARLARAGPTEFTLLIPDAPSRKAADWTLESAIPLLSRAARKPVASLVGAEDADPFTAVQTAVEDGSFDAIIVSTLPRRTSKWLRRDLIRRIGGLGLPVTAIVPGERRASLDETAEAMMLIERSALTGPARKADGPGIGEERPRYE